MARGWLPDLLGAIWRVNGEEQIDRQAVNFIAGDGLEISAEDNPATGACDVTFAIAPGEGDVELSDASPANLSLTTAAAGNGTAASRDNHVHTFPNQGANTVLANVTTGSAKPTAAAPQDLTFADATSGAGNIRLKVAPQGYGAVSSLATAGNGNVDITLAENGHYDFFVLVRVKLVAGGYRTVAARISGNRVSGTLTMEGTQVDVDMGGDATGITLTLSATSGNLRVNVANATGSTVNGRVHAGWTIEDLIADP